MTNPNEVSQLLQQLHARLAGSPTLGEQDRALLRQLSADIESALSRTGAPAANPTLAARLAEAVTRLEVSHPDVTRVLASVSQSLADMGI